MRKVQKVLIYITRERLGRHEVLVFKHRDFPDAGIQVPAGTVEPGEELESAARREVFEESGLHLVQPLGLVGTFDFTRADRSEVHIRNIFHIHLDELRDSWQHTVNSEGEDKDLYFDFYWIPVITAQNILAAGQGAYLNELRFSAQS